MSDKTVAEQIAVVVHLSRTAGGNFAQLPIDTLERWIREIGREQEDAYTKGGKEMRDYIVEYSNR